MATQYNTNTLTGRFAFRYGKKSASEFCVYGYTVDDTKNLPEFVSRNGGSVLVKVIGNNLPAVSNLSVKFYGEWKNDPVYGPQFCAKSFEYCVPKSKSGLIALFSSPAFPKIGKKTAEKLVNAFGLQTIDVIENNPEKIREVLKKEQADIIIKNYGQLGCFGRLVQFLSEYSISHAKCKRIYDVFGKDAEQIVRENPYVLIRIRGIGFRVCEIIGRKMGLALDSTERISAGTYFKLREELAQTGDMYMRKDDLRSVSLAMLNSGFKNPPISLARWNEVIAWMSREKWIAVQRDVTNPVDSVQIVYPNSYYNAEYWTAQNILKQMSLTVSPIATQRVAGALGQYCSETCIELDQTQKEAVMRSLANRVSIITGGPGTGKTTIISAIIDCYYKVFGREICLLAPTGKAARRMTESTNLPASTIHARLGLFDVENQGDSSTEKITEGLVIVDECSMVGTLLMNRLLVAIVHPNTHIVFVGDVDQLPSVEAGAVLRELIDSGIIPTTRLTKIYRQAGESHSIIDNARKINCGNIAIDFDDAFVFEQTESEAEAVKRVVELYCKEVAEHGIDDVALLCPLKSSQNGKYECCVESMNPALQEVINPPAEYKAEASINHVLYREGDRVMQTQNMPDACNGELGMITSIKSEGKKTVIRISWENGKTSELDGEMMQTVVLGYAMSIHKSQGSEYQSVIIPMLAEQQFSPIFKRNLLYTGVTRAKSKVILVGNEEAVNRCVLSEMTDVRKTMLGKRIEYNARTILADSRVESYGVLTVEKSGDSVLTSETAISPLPNRSLKGKTFGFQDAIKAPGKDTAEDIPNSPSGKHTEVIVQLALNLS